MPIARHKQNDTEDTFKEGGSQGITLSELAPKNPTPGGIWTMAFLTGGGCVACGLRGLGAEVEGLWLRGLLA